MNKKISTRVGLITGIVIFAFILIMHSMQLPAKSPIIGLQFLLLLIGLLVSCFLLYRYYDAVQFADAFKHCIRTLATILVIMVLGNTALFFALKSAEEPYSNLTIIIGYTIFAYSLSGILSSLFSSFIFNTFTKK